MTIDSTPQDGFSDVLDFRTGNIESSSKHILIFFITGNPGLVAYYRYLLGCIADTLSGDQNVCFHVHGRSLAGFETSSAPHVAADRPALPLNLDEQIQDVRHRLDAKAREIQKTHSLSDDPLPVILIGHSVGAFIALETTESNLESPRVNILGAINLFATVTDIAKSPTGRRIGWLLNIPGFPLFVHALVRVLLIVPMALMLRLVRFITGMPLQAAMVTTSFLRSRSGVRQALYMAQYELRQIDQDKWSDTFWGHAQSGHETAAKEASLLATDAAQSSTSRTPRLYFYWGKNDHWVADATRDQLIAKRAGVPDRVRMEIDTHGLPHSFCTTKRGSELVADKVAGYIKEIVHDVL